MAVSVGLVLATKRKAAPVFIVSRLICRPPEKGDKVARKGAFEMRGAGMSFSELIGIAPYAEVDFYPYCIRRRESRNPR